MAKTEHVHKYRRHKYSTGRIVLFCALPDCTKKTSPALALGKRSICWRCEKPFILNEYSLRLAKPHCEDCHQERTPKSKSSGDNKLFVSLPITNEIREGNWSDTKVDLSDDKPPQSSLAERLKKVVNHVKVYSEDEEL